MKTSAAKVVLSIASFFILSPPAITWAQNSKFTFSVCEVKIAEDLVAEEDYWEVMNFYAAIKTPNPEFEEMDSASQQAPPKASLEAYGRHEYQKLIATHGVHPFISAVHRSYAEHRPLRLSPDMIWLLIAQGFSAHVAANSDSLRYLFVDHGGRKVLNVRRDDYVRGDSLFPWPEVFQSLSAQIQANTKGQIAELISADFSTTGMAEKTAFEVSLMDAMSEYFLYTFSSMCGIPEITLEGKPEDWADIEQRAAKLEAYGLKWWLQGLQPVLHEFTLASQGNIHPAFWQDFYKITEVDQVCNVVEGVNGWILQFFPYIDGQPNPWVKNPDQVAAYKAALTEARQLRETPSIKRKLERKGNINNGFKKQRQLLKRVYPGSSDFGLRDFEPHEFPMGMSEANLVLDYHGQMLAYALNAGFVGIQQDPLDKSLRPEINWMVIDKNCAPSAQDVALYQAWLERR